MPQDGQLIRSVDGGTVKHIHKAKTGNGSSAFPPASFVRDKNKFAGQWYVPTVVKKKVNFLLTSKQWGWLLCKSREHWIQYCTSRLHCTSLQSSEVLRNVASFDSFNGQVQAFSVFIYKNLKFVLLSFSLMIGCVVSKGKQICIRCETRRHQRGVWQLT